ncbi:hypothetical protein DH2020_026233 [Rehmannia glutinosa]|uniref:Cytochrome P450 n=1 Tax=Rehmannia glutinosa TaxID=99300 RepID=A0ABR0VYE9_REHGL
MDGDNIDIANVTAMPYGFPPGPPGWPLVGNIFDLGQIPHQTLYKLQAHYGPVIWLKLGSINTMVVQSAKAASELFKKCDLPFADRKVPDSLTALGYNRGSVAFGAYSGYWRKLRRICTTEFLVQKRVNDSIPLRQKCIDDMIDWIQKDVAKSKENGGSGEIQLDWFLFVTSFYTIGNFMLSREVMESTLDKTSEFFEALLLFFGWIGKPNLSDLFPLLRWMDPQRIRRNTGAALERLLGFAAGIVKDRIEENELGKEKKTKDFLDTLLEEGEVNETGHDKLSLKNITILLLRKLEFSLVDEVVGNMLGNNPMLGHKPKFSLKVENPGDFEIFEYLSILQEMFLGGIETTSTTIEWGMAELLRHPNTMKKIQDEIDQVVGRTRKVEENDLNNMPYLQATVKEIMRLHPPVPMLIPRNAREDTEFMGYFVPKNTQIFVNAWAIHRDPATWPDPLSFKPERFLDSDIDYKGQHFQMIPFGSGRRSCLGLTLGHKMLSSTIASLLQTFDWKLAGGAKPEAVDMRETVGLLRKKVPLKAIPSLRE